MTEAIQKVLKDMEGIYGEGMVKVRKVGPKLSAVIVKPEKHDFHVKDIIKYRWKGVSPPLGMIMTLETHD